MTYGPNSVSGLAYRGSEKSPLNHSTFIFEFSLGVHTLEITPKPRDSSAEIYKSLLVTKEWNEPSKASKVMNMLTPEEDEICGKHKGCGLTIIVIARKIWR
jgi:hypothetical protein